MKKGLILCILIFITGCNNKINQVETIMEQNLNSNICINYPITNISKLDILIEKTVSNIHKDFKKNTSSTLNNKSELNIDYSYYEINNYTMITLTSYINDTINTKNFIETFLYDSNQNKLLDINDVIDTSNTKYFSFDENYFYLYNNINNEIETKKYEISDLNLKIDISNNEIKKIENKTETKTKILDPNGKFIALTFDDGPSIYTNKIIELLKEYDINATFFILGNKVEIYKDILKKSIEYGNELGNHSYNHKWLIKLDDESIKEQVNKTQEVIKNTLGYTPTLFRPTYGSLNEKVKKDTNLKIVLWNVDTLDWKYKNVNSIVERATKKLKDGNIILMHETYKRSYEALKKIIPIIKEKGFTFVTISELEEINKLRAYEK